MREQGSKERLLRVRKRIHIVHTREDAQALAHSAPASAGVSTVLTMMDESYCMMDECYGLIAAKLMLQNECCISVLHGQCDSMELQELLHLIVVMSLWRT